MNNRKLFTWRWGSHVHGRGSNWRLSGGKQWGWWSHLTSRGFIPARLSLAGPRGWSLTHGLIPSVCAWGFRPATAVSGGFPLCLWGFVPAVLANTSCGTPMTRGGVAGCVPPRSGSTSWCVAGSGVPHTGARRGTWGLTAFRAARGFIPTAVWRCVCRGVSWSLQSTRTENISENRPCRIPSGY